MADKIAERITEIIDAHAEIYSEPTQADLLRVQCRFCGWVGELRLVSAHVADVLAAELRAQIPTVAHKAADDTDLDLMRGAAAKLDTGYAPGGGNVTYAVSRLLRQASIALEGCSPEELDMRAKNGWAR